MLSYQNAKRLHFLHAFHALSKYIWLCVSINLQSQANIEAMSVSEDQLQSPQIPFVFIQIRHPVPQKK